MIKMSLSGGLVFLLTAALYSADCGFQAQIPYQGGRFSCLICHTPGTSSGQALNGFGRDFKLNGKIWTQSLARLDSDGDTYNNDYELNVDQVSGGWNRGSGVPCCPEYIANPGDALSIPSTATQDQAISVNTAQLKASPNPFNPQVNIQVLLPATGLRTAFTLSFHSLDGKLLQVIRSGTVHNYLSVSFNASGYASGPYIIRCQAGRLTLTKKVFLSK